jgi:hypothetical protein
VIGNWTTVWKTGESVASAVAIMKELESSWDPVDIMEKYQIQFVLDDVARSFFPANYTKPVELQPFVPKGLPFHLWGLFPDY